MKGNHRNPQPVIPVTSRKFSRQFIKNRNGNNGIQQAWRRAQIELYGFKRYIAMRLFKTPKNQRKEAAYRLYNGL
jgi:hypothetical protein